MVKDRAAWCRLVRVVLEGGAHRDAPIFPWSNFGSRVRVSPYSRFVEHSHLNDEQFAALANAGGASRRLSDNRRPTSGIMVGIPGLEQRLPHPITAEHVARHRAIMAVMEGTGSGVYQGAWRANHEGKPVVVLDHSTRMPDTPTGEKRARQMGTAGHQDALWRVLGLNDGEEIPLNPADRYGEKPVADHKIQAFERGEIPKGRGTTGGVIYTDRRRAVS